MESFQSKARTVTQEEQGDSNVKKIESDKAGRVDIVRFIDRRSNNNGDVRGKGEYIRCVTPTTSFRRAIR